jgi:TonB dependent receptor-like, beta-barrel/CarboxypepD_reg-like domain/TonB-dependent Receptor Plug Domain
MLNVAKKWLTIVLIGLSGSLAVGQTNQLNQPIILDVRDQPLSEVLEIIDLQAANLSFAFNPAKIPLRALVTYRADKLPLHEVLNYLSSRYHLDFALVEKQIVLTPSSKLTPLTFAFSGFVVDKKSGEALIGATVVADNSLIGTVANGYGFFSLDLPYGEHTIQTSFLGFEIASHTLDFTKNISFDIALSQSAPELQEIVVHGSSPTIVEQIQTGKVTLAPAAVAEIPAAFGEHDVIKSLENIPGINLQSDGSTFFFVRGGNKDQNLILIDDAPIYNPSHLLGIFSAIVPDAVNSIDVYKSDFPLSKGGRLSSVIDIKTKEGNKNRFSGWGNIGLVSTQLGIEGPFKKDNSSYILSGRLSRIKWIVKQDNPDLEKFQFYDLTGKTNFRLNKNNRLYFSFYSGSDEFLAENNGLGWTNINGSVRWNNVINAKTFMNFTIYGTNYEYLLYVDRSQNVSWRSRIGELGIKTDFSHFINSNQELSFGLNINGRTINPGNLIDRNNISEDLIVSVKNNIESVAYFQHEIKTKGNWGFKYGLRASLWTSLGESFEFIFNEDGLATDTLVYETGQIYNNYFQLEPRVTSSYTVGTNSSFKLSYGRSVQNLHLMTNSISPFTSFEVWLPSGPNIKPQLSDQISLGYYYHMPNLGISLNTEAYYKLMRNQIDYEDHASTLLNPTIESELLFGQVKAYGVEFLAKKEEGRLRGLIGYTYSRAKSNFADINDGRIYPAYFDKPHQINANINYDIGLRVTLGTNFTYTSGQTFSSPTSFYLFDDNEVPIYDRKNNDRFPAYHRLDISAKFILNKNLDKNFRHSLTVSIYNVYARKNPIFINFNKSVDESGKFEVATNLLDANRITSRTFIYRLTPSISYQFRF